MRLRKLSRGDRREIRRRYRDGERQHVLAAAFGVSQQRISAVLADSEPPGFVFSIEGGSVVALDRVIDDPHRIRPADGGRALVPAYELARDLAEWLDAHPDEDDDPDLRHARESHEAQLRELALAIHEGVYDELTDLRVRAWGRRFYERQAPREELPAVHWVRTSRANEAGEGKEN